MEWLIIENSITFEALIGLIISASLILFGLSGGENERLFKSKYLVIIYGLGYLLLIFNASWKTLFSFFMLIFLSGPIIQLNQGVSSIARVLATHQLITFLGAAWLLSNKIYIFVFSTAFAGFIVHYFNYNSIALTILYLVIFLYHFKALSIDEFDFKDFDKAFSFLGITLFCPKEFELLPKLDDDMLERLSFLVFMEDKNMFLRENPSIGYVDLKNTYFIKKIIDDKEFQKDFRDVEFNGEISNENMLKKLLNYIRGFSTIEQQFIRRHILKDGSYKYRIRRTFLTKLYTRYFFKALVKFRLKIILKSNRIGFNLKVRKRIKSELRFNLKFHFLVSYYYQILDNPSSIEELINSMQMESRVSENIYQKIFQAFKKSTAKETLMQSIKEASDLKYNFFLKNTPKKNGCDDWEKKSKE